VLRTSSHIKPTDLLEAQRNHEEKAHEIKSLTKFFMWAVDLRMQQKFKSLIIADFNLAKDKWQSFQKQNFKGSCK